MFDPTAYENIKVVFEGLIYDYDLNGDILITERNDFVNLADLSRCYNIFFANKSDKKNIVVVKLELKSSFQQLASEWMPMHVRPGADFTVEFAVHDLMNEILEKRLIKFFKKKSNHHYKFDMVKKTFLDQSSTFHFIFERYDPISENNLEELTNIVQDIVEIGKTLYNMILQ